MLVHEEAPIGIGIARKLSYQEMTQERVEVEVLAPIALHLVEMRADVVLLGGYDAVLVGRLDGHGSRIRRIET